MMTFRDLTLRLRALLSPSQVDRDLHDELSFHIERDARKLIDEGMPPNQARATAQARFGSPAVVADECRDERGTALVDNTVRDVRFALRSFRRAPLTAFTIVTTVAIGLGVVAVLFIILNRFLFRADAVPDISEMYGVERSRLAMAISRRSRGRRSMPYAGRPLSLPTPMPLCTTSTCASMAG
jgi:putative ABC transport system permease protein